MCESDQDRRGDHISANISGPVSGQIGVGKDIAITRSSGSPAPITEQEIAQVAELKGEIAALRAQIEVESPPETKDEALEKVQELEDAIASEKPDPTMLIKVQGWFARNLPMLAGAVTSVVVHPLVGRLVESAGDIATEEIRTRFGHSNRSR